MQLLASRLDAEGSENEALLFGERLRFRLNVPGRHMVMNALGVLAVATLLGIDPEEAAAALAAALRPGDVVLVKGSYGVGMKLIIDRLSGEGRT